MKKDKGSNASITDPLVIAHNDHQAQLARQSDIDFSEKIFKAELLKAEQEGLTKEFLSKAKFASIIIQPFYPKKTLIAPKVIKEKLINIRDGDGTFHLDFPLLNELKSIPGGIASFEWRQMVAYDYQFLNTKGTLRLSVDIVRVNDEGKKFVYLTHITMLLFELLRAAGNFYKIADYQGELVGVLKLEKISDATFLGFGTFHHTAKALLSNYQFDFNLNTNILNDYKKSQDYLIKLVREIHWGVGCDDVLEENIKTFLKEKKWLVE